MDATSKEGNLEVTDGDRKRPLIKPTKYHYYPHNQHLYLLPECATQQVSFGYYYFLTRTTRFRRQQLLLQYRITKTAAPVFFYGDKLLK